MNVPASSSPVNTETGVTAPAKPKKLLEQVREEMRLRRYSLRTEKAWRLDSVAHSCVIG